MDNGSQKKQQKSNTGLETERTNRPWCCMFLTSRLQCASLTGNGRMGVQEQGRWEDARLWA